MDSTLMYLRHASCSRGVHHRSRPTPQILLSFVLFIPLRDSLFVTARTVARLSSSSSSPDSASCSGTVVRALRVTQSLGVVARIRHRSVQGRPAHTYTYTPFSQIIPFAAYRSYNQDFCYRVWLDVLYG